MVKSWRMKKVLTALTLAAGMASFGLGTLPDAAAAGKPPLVVAEQGSFTIGGEDPASRGNLFCGPVPGT